MTKTDVEPQQLLARLERKFARKVQAVHDRRKVKGCKQALSQIDGVYVDNNEKEVIDRWYSQEV